MYVFFGTKYILDESSFTRFSSYVYFKSKTVWLNYERIRDIVFVHVSYMSPEI